MNTSVNAQQPKLWTRDFIVIMILALFNSICMQMMNPTMPLYLKSLGGNTTLGGLANGLLAIAALIFRPISGYLVEKIGRRKLILIGTVIFASGILLVNVVPSIAITLAARFIQGIGFSLVTTACGTVVTDIVPAERLNEGIGYYGLSNSLSTALGPSIALYIIGSLGYWWLFNIAFGVVVLVAFLTTTVTYEKRMKEIAQKSLEKEKEKKMEREWEGEEPGKKENDRNENVKKKDSGEKDSEKEDSGKKDSRKKGGKKEGGQEEPVRGIRTVLGVLFEKTALPASAVQFVLTFGTASIFNFLAYYGLSIGIDGIGMFFTVSAVFMVLSRLMVGKLINRFGTRNLLIGTIFIAGCTYLTLIAANQLIHFIIIGAIHGFLSGIIYASLNITAVRDAQPNRRGVATATYLCSMDLGVGIGSVFWGKIADLAGFQVVYFFTSVFVFVCLLLTVLLLGKSTLRKVMAQG